MKILVYALHISTPYSKGYIGGAWIRFLEFLKRAKKYNIKYVLIEPPPKFGDNYESIQVTSNGYEEIAETAYVIFKATVKGFCRALKRDIDLILCPIESPHNILPAFMTSVLTAIPFTVIIHNTPIFHDLIEKYPKQKFTISLRDIYKAIKYHKHRRKSITFIILSTFFNYFVTRILRTTTIIGVGSGSTYMQSLDKNFHVKEVFPGNSIPSSAIADRKKNPETKTYDAIYVGTLTKEKGVMDAIRAWRLVTLHNPSLKLHLIGMVPDRIMLQEINSLINKLDLGNNISICDNPLVGASAEILFESMKQSKILLFPSIMEAWSFTVGEALSLGLPVIAYDIQAYNKAYPECKALIKVPICNQPKLATEANRLLENPNELKKLSKEAVKYMKNYCTWEQVISAETQIYRIISSAR